MTDWAMQRKGRQTKLAAVARSAQGEFAKSRDATVLREAPIKPGDRVCIEGDDQTQADFYGARIGFGESRRRARFRYRAIGVYVVGASGFVQIRDCKKNAIFAIRTRRAGAIARALAEGSTHIGAIQLATAVRAPIL